jgi:hypothetical protein
MKQPTERSDGWSLQNPSREEPRHASNRQVGRCANWLKRHPRLEQGEAGLTLLTTEEE